MAPDFFSDFAALAAYLEGLCLFRMRPGLERTRAVLQRLGLERAPYTAVQVVGTNGKGSTSVMLARLAEEHGLKTGLYTSPHFVSMRERVRVNRAMLSEAAWTELGNRLLRAGAETLSWFEFTTCLCVLAFAEAGVDLAVMESGLGGTWDAVTATPADLVVFTPIDLDHEAILGPDIADIAADKAGAMRPGKPALTGPQSGEALEEIRKGAQRHGCPLLSVDASQPLPFIPGKERPALSGRHQLDNARLALAAFRVLRDRGIFPPPVLARLAAKGENSGSLEAAALCAAFLPGRMQRVKAAPAGQTVGEDAADEGSAGARLFPLGRPCLLLDGAHNAHGLAALGASLAAEGTAPAAVIFSCLLDKDLERMLPHLRALATGPVFVPPIRGNPRAANPEETAARIGINACAVPSLSEALREASSLILRRLPEAAHGKAEKNPLLICGSLYLLGEFYSLFPRFLESPS
ncbi:MAG: bifunctional folylpolyglutamate synthase/dihydrofolate synthase [Desulfovibrio sp.]|jgi:dihydrofolate synthase/folylpolyglutamate synthase|nr:bifunctional folylpolyglutamate synthase/dihydrofolate synthase [Desulfovibrio sp.]